MVAIFPVRVSVASLFPGQCELQRSHACAPDEYCVPALGLRLSAQHDVNSFIDNDDSDDDGHMS
jgi:hypothetical protein